MKNNFQKGSAGVGIVIVVVIGLVILFIFTRSDPGPEFNDTEQKIQQLQEEDGTSLDE